MMYVIEENTKEMAWMNRAVEALMLCNAKEGLFVSFAMMKKKQALFVNVDRLSEKVSAQICSVDYPVVLYVCGKWSALSDEKKKLVFPLLLRENVGAVFGYPFSFYELYRVYHALEEKRRVSNESAIGAIQRSVARKIRNQLVTVQSEQEKTDIVFRIEKELGIRVRESEIRAEVKDVETGGASSVALPTSSTIVRGVFCDAEGSLLTYMNDVNKGTLRSLRTYEQNRNIVVLLTNGDVENAKKILREKNIRDLAGKEYTVIHKRHYAGKRVERVIDACPDMNIFQMKYRIFPEKYECK